jgi:hypothetical protein
MSLLYTKRGRPLRLSGDNVYSRSGVHVGRVRGGKVYDPRGRYAGTVVGDRVIYRQVDSASIGSPCVRSASAGIAAAPRVPSALWGDEPDFPD